MFWTDAALNGAQLGAGAVVRFWADRKGQIVAIDEQKGDLGVVKEVIDRSTEQEAVLEICLENGESRCFRGSAKGQPNLGEHYFITRLCLDHVRVQVWDDGYHDYSGEPSNASPRPTVLTLTLHAKI